VTKCQGIDITRQKIA